MPYRVLNDINHSIFCNSFSILMPLPNVKYQNQLVDSGILEINSQCLCILELNNDNTESIVVEYFNNSIAVAFWQITCDIECFGLLNVNGSKIGICIVNSKKWQKCSYETKKICIMFHFDIFLRQKWRHPRRIPSFPFHDIV